MTTNLKTSTLVNSNERVDELGRRGYKLIQNPKVFCFGVDAVLLAHYAKVKNEKEHILDIGTGTGIVPILMHGIYQKGSYTGMDIQQEMVEMANRSVLLNNLQDAITMKHVDITKAKEAFKAASFDVITCNPPYMKGEAGLKNEDLSKQIARHEITCTLEDIIAAGSYLLKERGRFYMIHRPHRLVDILSLMRQYKIEPKTMRMVYPKRDKEPTMVLVEAIRGANPELRVQRPLVIYQEDGTYTDDLIEIYKDSE